MTGREREAFLVAQTVESACNVGDLGSIPGPGRSQGEGNANPLQYSCLGNPKDGGAWQAIAQGVTKNQIQQSESQIYILFKKKFFMVKLSSYLKGKPYAKY